MGILFRLLNHTHAIKLNHVPIIYKSAKQEYEKHLIIISPTSKEHALVIV